jgi:hypothetical protein
LQLITLGSDLELEEAKRLQPTVQTIHDPFCVPNECGSWQREREREVNTSPFFSQVLRLNVYDSKPRRHTTDQLPTPKLEAAFVRDVTVPDGTNVGARVKFQKVPYSCMSS